MKFIVAVCFFVLATLVSVQAEDDSVIQTCKDKSGCKEDILAILKSDEPPKTQECMCTVGCLGKARGIVTDSGLDKEKFKAALQKINMPEDKINAIVDNCKVTTTDDCEIAKSIYACNKS